eukprot:5682535-Prorocentrum_lima.AAC.1
MVAGRIAPTEAKTDHCIEAIRQHAPSLSAPITHLLATETKVDRLQGQMESLGHPSKEGCI